MFTTAKRRTALFALIFLFSSILFALPGYFLYLNIKNLIIEELGRNATSVAASVAEIIEQKPDDYRNLISVIDYDNETYDEEYYQEMLIVFQNLKSAVGADYIYTEKRIDEDTIAYIFDAEIPGTDDYSPIGSTDYLSKYEIEAYSSHALVTSPIEYYEEWGTFLSGYAPIIDDETGEFLGLVGVDFSLEYVSELILSVRLILTVSLTFLVLISSFLIYKLLDLRMEALNKDYLTGLYSKRYQEARLRKAIKDSRSKNLPLSLIMLDVDYFKEINDRFGHYIGDVVLKEVANVIMYNTRNIDICSRYGGDEFLIILPNTLPEEAASIGDNIKKNILKIEIVDEKIQISVSMGIALWDHVSEINDFITQADKAMYVSKNTGKNKLTIYK